MKQQNQCATITYGQYIQSIAPIKIESNFNYNDIMNGDDQKQLRQFAGKMLWVSRKTRSDMAFEVCMMCNTVKSSIMKKMVEANKAITKRKCGILQLKFGAIDEPKKIEILLYSDVIHASLDHGASQGAPLIAIRKQR